MCMALMCESVKVSASRVLSVMRVGGEEKQKGNANLVIQKGSH